MQMQPAQLEAITKELATLISERTGSETVQVIGKRIILYKPSKTKATIVLPK